MAEGEGMVMDGGIERGGADLKALLKPFVVQSKTGGVLETGSGREVQYGASPKNLPAAVDGGAAQGGDVGLLAGSLQEEGERRELWDSGEVVSRENLDLIDVLGGDLEARAQSVAALPEVAVVECTIEPQVAGAGAVPVIELDAPMEREAVLDLEIYIHHAGFFALPDGRGYPPVWPSVEGEQIGAHRVELGKGARGKGLGLFLDLAGQKVSAPDDTEPSHGVLRDLEVDDAPAWPGEGDLHKHRFVALGLVEGLECSPRGFHILRSPPWAQEGIDCASLFKL